MLNEYHKESLISGREGTEQQFVQIDSEMKRIIRLDDNGD